MHFDVLQLLERRWKTITVAGLICMLIAGGLSFLRPLEYSSSSRLLIIQKASLNLDPYTAIQSAERIADNLSQVIYTSVFFDRVMNAGFQIDKTYFNANENKRRTQWAKMVTTVVTHSTGFLEITVYHTDPSQASEIGRAIAYVMTTEGNNYIGGHDLQIQLVDTPLQSRYPVRPNILLNAFLGAVIGVLLSALYLIIGEARKHRPTVPHEHGSLIDPI